MRRAITVVALLGAFALAASPWLGRTWALADLAAQFLLQAAVATALLGCALLLRRRLLAGAVAAAALALQLAWLLPFAGAPVGRALASPGDVAPLRIVFFNVWRENDERGAVADWLRRERPDIVVLAEVGRGEEPMLDALAELVPHRLDCRARGGCDLAILSREPLPTALLRAERGGTHVVEARVPFGDGTLRVLGTHLTRPVGVGTLERQLVQAERIAETVSAEPGPVVLVGDLNAVPWGAVVSRLRTGTGLASVATLDGTWPAFLPWPLRIQIDNALVSSGVQVTGMRISPFLGSDHRAIVLDVLPRPLPAVAAPPAAVSDVDATDSGSSESAGPGAADTG